MVHSNYLNQCWLIISTVPWHSSEGFIMRKYEDTNQWISIENLYFSKIEFRYHRGQWVNYAVAHCDLLTPHDVMGPYVSSLIQDVYRCTWNSGAPVNTICSHKGSAKPLSTEPMLIFSNGHTYRKKFMWKYNNFANLTLILKCCLQNGGHFEPKSRC